jgi:hypothetical protein
MAEPHDDLVGALAQLGGHLVVARSDERDPVAGALREIAGASPSPTRAPASSPTTVLLTPSLPRLSRRIAIVAVAVVVLAGALLVAAPGPRAAVARFLGIGGVRVVTTREVPYGFAQRHGLGDGVPVERALAQALGPIEPAGVGDPMAAFAGQPPGGVSLVWPASDDLPDVDAAEPTGVGLIVTAFPGSTDTPVVAKQIGPSTILRSVLVGGRPGYWISGHPHVVEVLDASGEPVPDVMGLAGNTLLWTDGTITYRLESAIDREAAIALAESIAPTGG